MNIIKIILAILGIILGVMLFFWLLGIVTSLLWYGLWIAVIGGIGYGAYRLFRKAEDKYVGAGSARTELGDRDFDLSWDEYEKKYLNK
ncbi:hypothetical protein [Leptolyngbya sp. 7M]|uniref:hypothetical protein n=1 Tax=Leptolyngbya sp. 7M TaxID=2812896 RepID=UPI001B8AC6D6|nr:hypothetical protein [Leptolyngbya sp. 7M]QYO67338.1 hypothetical protein JVX88_11355 [Leptolyngbya sp. 7M]